jgi:hypothetical protein
MYLHVGSFKTFSSEHATSHWFGMKEGSRFSNEEQEPDSEEQKREKMFARVVRNIRSKVVLRRLDGAIHVRRVCGIVAIAMECSINSSGSVTEHYEEEDVSDLPSQFQRAISGTDIALDSLERRALGWEGVEFSDDVKITRGVCIGISDPFLGIMNWSITVDITATVKSLLCSKKRVKASLVSASSKC